MQQLLSISWELLIGLGTFLYGMSRLETGISALSDTRLKHWLVRSTGSPLASAGFGALITTILQSSSMVSLLVLAFASAGIMPLYNAIGVVIGANLGTTVTGWIVATLGFKLELSKLALPLLGFGGLVQVVTQRDKRLYNWGKTATGLGLLLFGLTLMKDSVGDLSHQWDISLLQGYHPVIYLLTGLLVTALIQSSSATVMLTLTALHAGLINLPEAGAMVIGADLGTTGTILLASLTGPGIKRQLALAQVLFNIAVVLIAFIVLLPLLAPTIEWLGIDAPLYSLVAFHSTINLLGLFFFLPLLKPFSRWVEKFFQSPQDSLTTLAAIASPVPEAALPAMTQSLQTLWLVAAMNTMQLLGIKTGQLTINPEQRKMLNSSAESVEQNTNHLQVYEHIKQQEAAIFQLVYKLQQLRLDEPQSQQLGQMQELARSIVYASKAMKDITKDIQRLNSASDQRNETARWQLQQQQLFLSEMYSAMIPLILSGHESNYLQEQLEILERRNELHAHHMELGVYQRASSSSADEPGLSIQLNVNREILHANRDLLYSIGLWQSITSGSV